MDAVTEKTFNNACLRRILGRQRSKLFVITHLRALPPMHLQRRQPRFGLAVRRSAVEIICGVIDPVLPTLTAEIRSSA